MVRHCLILASLVCVLGSEGRVGVSLLGIDLHSSLVRKQTVSGIDSLTHTEFGTEYGAREVLVAHFPLSFLLRCLSLRRDISGR
jgi:hypothetical protein